MFCNKIKFFGKGGGHFLLKSKLTHTFNAENVVYFSVLNWKIFEQWIYKILILSKNFGGYEVIILYKLMFNFHAEEK